MEDERRTFEVVIEERWERVFRVKAQDEDEALAIVNANQAQQVVFERVQVMDDVQVVPEEVES